MVDKKTIMKALEKVIDPETGVDVVRMGMIKGIEIKGNDVKIRFTPTIPFCPMINYLVNEIEQAAKAVKGIKEVKVEVSY